MDALAIKATTPAFRPRSRVVIAAVTDDTITAARIRASLFGRIGGSATLGAVTIGTAADVDSDAIAPGH